MRRLLIAAVSIACGTADAPKSIPISETPATEGAYSARPTTPVSSAEAERGAREIVSFLRGEGKFDPGLFADSVTLLVSPEGGSGSGRFARDGLRRPANWVVGSTARRSFVPGKSLRVMTVRSGVHFNCREYPLATRYPHLAHLPHVGVRLAADKSGNCLQTWNVTLVFSDSTTNPVLVAAVYDQWEW